MDIDKVKLLRKKINIPITEAIQLLKKNKGDIALSEHVFHSNNIKEIQKNTDCDEKTAEENYKLFSYDIKKAIQKINERGIVLTTRESKIPRNEIGFILWPENKNGETYKTIKRNDVFIPTADFEYIIDEFKAVFPLKDPWTDTIEDYFDTCSHNSFNAETSNHILKKIKMITHEDDKVQLFLQEVITWFTKTLEYADYIIIYGNL